MKHFTKYPKSIMAASGINKYRKGNRFTDDQLRVIQLGLDDRLPVDTYADPEFNSWEMLEIYKGLKRGLDVSWYAKPEFNCYQMEWIRKGLEAQFDVSLYANPEFDDEQMAEIYRGLRYNVDVSWYANPEFSEDLMSQLRECLEAGIDVSKIVDPKYSPSEILQLADARLNESKQHAANKYDYDEDDYEGEEEYPNYTDYIQYVVYELDPENDYEELNSIQAFSSLADAKKFAQSCDFPTHIVFVPTMDPDDDPDFAEWLEENFEIEPYEEIIRYGIK